jgi:hypothetical protein
MRMRSALGLDDAVAYTFLARAVNIVGSTGTVLLIMRFLSPVEQGYYYTLLSLVALQTIFELGFSFVILQLAAHESALLTIFPDGHIEGDPVAHARLASILKLTISWYLRAAGAMAVTLLSLGIGFFSREAHTAVRVQWLGPWVTAVLAVSVTFLLTPLYSFFEGCNQVRQVARLRMDQALIVLAMSWGAIASRYGLYACALVNLGWIAIGVVFLARRRGLLLSLLRYPVHENAVSWRNEIWPFQWKIAVTWLCSYFTMQVFTPILFAFRGPQEAGKMGLSLSIAGFLPVIALCWITPKAAPFGQLIKFGRLQELDTLFFKTLKQSMALVLILAASCLAAVIGAQYAFPGIAARMVAPSIFVLLLFAAIGSFVVQSMAIYLRSFKREPYLIQSIAVSGLTLIAVLLMAPQWGNAAVAIIYFTTNGIVGPLWAIAIFHAQRKLQSGQCSNIDGMPKCAPTVAGVAAVMVRVSGVGRGAQ